MAADDPQRAADQEQVFTIVEEMPLFPGGEGAMYMHLANNIVYPRAALEAGAQGTSYISFVVGRDGVLRDIKDLRSPHPALAQEAIRVVGTMPPWTPGKQRGEAVSVQYTLPIKFTQRNEPPPESEPEPETTFTRIESMPEFPGGVEAMYKFLWQSMKYPIAARDAGVQGTVYTTFEIDSLGIIRDARVQLGVHPLLDAEALRVVNSMPPWNPGKQDGKPVRVQFNLPLRFVLKEEVYRRRSR